MGVAWIVPLEMNSGAHPSTLDPNTCNTTRAVSTMSASMRALTSNSSLSSTHSKCWYFLAKSIDQRAHITSMMDDESVNEKSSKTYKDFRFADLKCQKKM
uniref:Uncharacterized protein n=1 Tax=Romanomermis culicivorax TaxID=13658 RepID=A0A915KHL5_ROMCU